MEESEPIELGLWEEILTAVFSGELNHGSLDNHMTERTFKGERCREILAEIEEDEPKVFEVRNGVWDIGSGGMSGLGYS